MRYYVMVDGTNQSTLKRKSAENVSRMRRKGQYTMLENFLCTTFSQTDEKEKSEFNDFFGNWADNQTASENKRNSLGFVFTLPLFQVCFSGGTYSSCIVMIQLVCIHILIIVQVDIENPLGKTMHSTHTQCECMVMLMSIIDAIESISFEGKNTHHTKTQVFENGPQRLIKLPSLWLLRRNIELRMAILISACAGY